MRTTSLGQETNFTQILPLLGVTVNSTVLPAIVDCPCCRSNRLHVYRDTTERQDWAYCWHCGFSGDMIELAAATWKLDLAATVVKLLECSIPFSAAHTTYDALVKYHRDHIEFRQRVAGFWKDVREYALANESIVCNLCRALDLPAVSNDWLRRGTRFFGVSSYDMLVKYIFGDRRNKVSPSDIRKSCKLAPEAFRGPNWAHVLVMPFYNLPGRVCGMLVYGLDEKKQPTSAYLPIMNVYGSTNHEAGLAMLDNATLPRHTVFDDSIFAMVSPLMALKLQLAKFRDSEMPLPIVATFSGHNAESCDVWKTLQRRNVICWSPVGHPEAIKQAYRAGASVSLFKPVDPALHNALEVQQPEDALRRISGPVVPWQAALRKRLGPASRPDTEVLLQFLGLPTVELQQFAEGSEPLLQQRLEDIRQHVGAVRTVKFGGRTICEQDNKWIVDGGENICNAVLRIEQAITSSKHQTYYRGNIYFQNKKIPFLERADTIERYGFDWMMRYVRDQAGGGVMSYAPGMQRRLHALAILFHTPEHVSGVERLGWDEDRRCFQFPGFSIAGTGTTDTFGTCLSSGPSTPGKGLIKPADRMPVRCVQQLSGQHDECNVLWATAAAVVSNLIAPAIFREPKGILLDGPGAQAIGEAVAVLMGCPEVVYETNERVASALQTQLDQHPWPFVLRPAARRTLTPGRWLNTPEASRVIVSLPSTTVQVLGLRRQWHIIHCPRRLGSLQLTGDSASFLLPHYLQDLCGRQFSREGRLIGSPLEVLQDMTTWFGEYGGHAPAVSEAKRLLEEAGEHIPLHRFFVRLVAYGVAEQYIRPARESCVNFADVLYLEEDNSVWISQRAVSDFALRQGELPLDVLLVTQALEHAGALRAERSLQTELGWVVARDWWDTQWRSLAHKD